MDIKKYLQECDGIIFDIDGTMWDSTEICARGYNRAIDRLLGRDYPHCNAAILKKLFGKTTQEIGAGLFPDRTRQEQYDFTMECIREEMVCFHETPPVPFEGLREVLELLKGHFPMFIVSNCECGYIEFFMESGGLEEYFTDHLCPGDTGLDKKGNIGEIIRRHGLKKAVYIGDVQGDADSAHGAGIPIIYAAYGFGTVSDPDCTIQTLAQLPELFGLS